MEHILLNTMQVQELLEHQRSQTRILIKPQPKCPIAPSSEKGVWEETIPCANGVRILKPPYRVGDVLYVKETWRVRDSGGSIVDGTYWVEVEYKADSSTKKLTGRAAGKTHTEKTEWRPSVHLYKDVARLFVRVKEIRAERLQVDRTVHGWEANPYVWVIDFDAVPICSEEDKVYEKQP